MDVFVWQLIERLIACRAEQQAGADPPCARCHHCRSGAWCAGEGNHNCLIPTIRLLAFAPEME